MFKPIGSLIKEIPARTKTPKAILALQVRLAARHSLKNLCADLDPEIIESVRVLSLDGKTLKIAAPSLVCAELQMRSGGLIKDINRALGKKIVDKIRFKVS